MRNLSEPRQNWLKTRVHRGRAVAWLAALAIVLAGCSAGDDSGDARSSTSASPSKSAYENPSEGRQLALQEPGMHKVKTSTITYRGDLQMDVYQPDTDEGPAPVVLLVHGVGPGSLKDFGGFVGWGQLLATRGLATAVPNYRATDDGRDVNATKDLRAAVAYLDEHAEDLDIDPTAMAVLSFSAGGPFAIRLADELPADRLRALALFYTPLGGFADAERSLPDKYRLAAFLEQHPDVPVYATVGEEESAAIKDSYDEIEANLDDYPQLTLERHPNGGHRFDVLKRDTDSERIIGTTVDFLSGALTQP